MKHKTPRQRLIDRHKNLGRTYDPSIFKIMADRRTRRWHILSQGDSWFSYPRELNLYKNSNIMDYLCEWLYGNANFLRLENPGAEAIDIARNDEFEDFLQGLEVQRIDFVLLSMGGNDFGGSDDIHKFIRNTPQGGSDTFKSYIFEDQVEATLNAIIEAYEKHLSAVTRNHPNAHVLTHTYDFFQPSDLGIRILWNTIEISPPWVSIGMTNVPDHLQLKIVHWLMTRFKEKLLELANRMTHFHVVDTQNTLRPGHPDDWLNEIHPTPSGYEQIAKKVYARMRLLDPALPVIT